MFSTKHFTYGVTQSIGETAIAYSLTAARWGVIGWGWYTEAFFSDAAMARYKWVGEMIACLGMLAYLYGAIARQRVQNGVDAPANDAATAKTTEGKTNGFEVTARQGSQRSAVDAATAKASSRVRGERAAKGRERNAQGVPSRRSRSVKNVLSSFS